MAESLFDFENGGVPGFVSGAGRFNPLVELLFCHFSSLKPNSLLLDRICEISH
jgi:hypothetical protein